MAKKPPMKAAPANKAANKVVKSMAAATKAGKGPPAFGPKKKPCK